ncbi:LPS O-antigen subunit length determinant protein (WzzB/FepE family) [Natronocella acetinitrilica]|uniref:LPS O-antigen subunit length determinant protein (WzzB/FepE family) n=1 Tax=Natronocella acetinitrilica TaxID=414046 RepID=A0AAE3G5U6_9GAMM|nr:hypothetical protein [Natronocella acetinitrilica]MCP1676194.1 LPS O-antigen subunit length determinant protein (WzzB/FepE family) [Natronocella acetinitrilica]
MTQTQWLVMILIGELAIILALVLALVGILAMRKRGRDRAAADKLFNRVRASEASRQQWLRDTLATRGGLEGDALEAKINEVINAERRFYEQFMDLYVNRDTEAAEQMPERVDELVRPYVDIEGATVSDPGNTAESAATPAKPEVQPDVVDDIPVSATPAVLQERTRKLAADVTIYRQTLNRVFAEYTAMFGVHVDASRELSAQEIIDRLESGQLADPDEAPPTRGD